MKKLLLIAGLTALGCYSNVTASAYEKNRFYELGHKGFSNRTPAEQAEFERLDKSVGRSLDSQSIKQGSNSPINRLSLGNLRSPYKR